jgi:hypothetical protein
VRASPEPEAFRERDAAHAVLRADCARCAALCCVAPAIAAEMFESFRIVRLLHELLWYLHEALALAPPPELAADLRAALAETTRLAASGPEALARLDLTAHHARTNAPLRLASAHAGEDLAGASLAGADLRGADLSGTLFLVQSQLESATGDAATRLPSARTAPAHWARARGGRA